MKIWGWVLTSLGGITALETLVGLASGGGADGLVSALVFLIPGLLLLWMAARQVKRWDRYEALINKEGNTSIPMLARRMKLSEKTVYADLHRMISNDFFVGPAFNVEARIDGEHEMLVMCRGGVPIEPLPEKVQEEAPREEPAEGNWQDPEDIPQAQWQDNPIRVEMTDLETIQQAIAMTPEEDVRNSLYGLEGSLRRIDERVQENPELKKKSSIRNLYRYYMPQIIELIQRYQDDDTTEDTRRQIRKALLTSANALSNIEADLLESDQMDVEVDIEVLKNMFAKDGLIRDPFGAAAQQAKPGNAEEAPAQVNWNQAQTQPAQQAQTQPPQAEVQQNASQ